MEPYIYKYYPKEDVQKMLTAFHAATGMHTQLIDENGKIIFAVGKPAEFCRLFVEHLPPGDSCGKQHVDASVQAMDLGESYLFSCHAGMYHIVFPIVTQNTMFGAVVTGPFLMEEPDASVVLDLTKKYDIDTQSLLKMSDASHEVKVISPELANEYSLLLYYLIGSFSMNSKELLLKNQGKLFQQSKIGEAIHKYKNAGEKEDKEYPVELESRLITKVKTGDLAEARKTLNELLAILILYEDYSVDRLKVRIVELCALLSRAAIERGSDTNMVLEMNDRLINAIMRSDDMNDMCYQFQENMDIFTESLFFSSDQSSVSIKKATEYIAAHFAEEITLADVANEIHLNASYLSTLFKQVTGVSFKEYLNKIRIEEAQRLLLNTDYPIMHIAISCGFSDQSYFTKVFKKHTGLTPKQYR